MNGAIACENSIPTPEIDVVQPDSAYYCSVEEMQEACEKNGWSIEFRQLQAGQLTSSMAPGMCADILLLDQHLSRRIEVVGEAPDGYVTVLAPVGQAEFCINGQSFSGQGVFLLGSCAELHSVNNEVLRVFSMNVPISLLQQTGCRTLDTSEDHLRCQTLMIEPGAAIVQHLRSLMHATIHQALPGRWQVERASRLATELATIIDQFHKTPKTTCRTSPRNIWFTINRARDFIEAHLTEPISIGKVSEYSATSVSKLERIFRRELQMSPSQYILARRLAAVNRDLHRSRSNGMRIAQIAMDHGFHHLGRFAGAYRAHFGELPSETIGLH